jgi:hypothetical protein
VSASTAGAEGAPGGMVLANGGNGGDEETWRNIGN